MSEHREYRVYDECGHDHRDGEPGTTDVECIGPVCEEGYMYSVCYACHTDDGEMGEDGPWEQAWPCDAAKAQARVKELEKLVQDMLASVSGGRLVSIGAINNVHEPQIGVAEVKRWRAALAGEETP